MNNKLSQTAILSAVLASGSLAQAPPVPPPAPTNIRDARAVLAAAPKLTIKSPQLTVVLLPPDAEKGFYRGTRFDWAGMISSVSLSGHEYYGLWFDRMADNLRDFIHEGDAVIAGPNTAVLGPAEAFDPSNPPGWTDAAAGQGFLKIGVGILRKPDDGAPYSSFRPYEIIDHGRWQIAKGAEWVRFTHRLRDAATGYAYVYVKTIRLSPTAPDMTIEHSLENTGQKPIATSMFNHNFLTFGGLPTARLPTLTAPYAIEAATPPRGDAAVLVDGRLQYQRALANGETFSVGLKGYRDGADARFTITESAGASVTLVSDQPWSRVLLWSMPRTVAIEPYVALTLAPGQSQQWQTRYSFTPPR